MEAVLTSKRSIPKAGILSLTYEFGNFETVVSAGIEPHDGDMYMIKNRRAREIEIQKMPGEPAFMSVMAFLSSDEEEIRIFAEECAKTPVFLKELEQIEKDVQRQKESLEK